MIQRQLNTKGTFMSASILVTGATGTIGSQLLPALKEKGIDAAVMTSQPGRTSHGHRTLTGNFADPVSLREAFQGFETIFLLQPLVPQMVEFGINATAAAEAAGARHIVRLSAGGADSTSPFSILKAHGVVDDDVRRSRMKWTLVRPSGFMQNHITFNAAQIKSGTLYAPHGNGATALVDVRDIAECAAGILADPAAHQGCSYDLTGAHAFTNAEQMQILSEAIGRKVEYVDIPEETALNAMTAGGVPPLLIDWLMSVNAMIKAGYAAGVSEDVVRLTGHAPRTFATFAREYAQTWRD
jgi:NAD(P)H dehydrogenase (quinone)